MSPHAPHCVLSLPPEEASVLPEAARRRTE
jgi:hypothetical protein